MAMNEIVAEFIGTFLLILLGNGVVANVVLSETKGTAAAGLLSRWGGDWVFLWEWLWPDRYQARILIRQSPLDLPSPDYFPG